MKFLLNESISYDEIYSSVLSYMHANEGKDPSYLLVHPETRRKIMISSGDEMKGMQYRVEHNYLTNESGIKSTWKVCGLYLIISNDVEPGFMIYLWMRSKIANKILNETPPEVREKVRQYGKKRVVHKEQKKALK